MWHNRSDVPGPFRATSRGSPAGRRDSSMGPTSRVHGYHAAGVIKNDGLNLYPKIQPLSMWCTVSMTHIEMHCKYPKMKFLSARRHQQKHWQLSKQNATSNISSDFLRWRHYGWIFPLHFSHNEHSLVTILILFSSFFQIANFTFQNLRQWLFGSWGANVLNCREKLFTIW